MKPVHTLTTLSLAVVLAACAEQQPHNGMAQTSAEPASTVPRELRSAEEANAAAVAPLQMPMSGKVVPGASYAEADLAVAAAVPAGRVQWQPVDRENYLHYEENGVKRAAGQPVSTFSIDVDTASYANVRRMLNREGRLPPAAAVRLEEMINYFSYSYPAPASKDIPFSISTELAPAPWSDQHQLLQIGIRGLEPEAAQRPPANLVFLVDVSGSMQSPDKLELVKKSLRLLVNRMIAEDRIALAVYAGAAGTVLESTPGDEKAKILAAIDRLQAGGSTHGSAGIELAYQLAGQHLVAGGINRVIIASDGDMNVGTVNLEALKDLVARRRDSGIALTTLGFGSGNYNYALMEQLADVGNGNAAYIDSLTEAQKVLVNEMHATLHTIASDVKIQVEFNPASVSEYRLIGYENRLLEREDFRNDKVDAGDIGAGHTVTALYEIVLTGSGGERNPALRYGGTTTSSSADNSELAYIKLRYKQPGEEQSRELARVVQRAGLATELTAGSDDIRFAASVAGFGQLLRGGKYTGNWGYPQALQLARGARGSDPHGYRSEFLHLIELAQSLSSGS
ncbi:vWA domain-containing protein [Seongchinamella sediminis]|nr:VWA domain-containing protein [Seongchinamella sediminis]